MLKKKKKVFERMLINFQPEQVKWLKEYSEVYGTSVNSFIRMLVWGEMQMESSGKEVSIKNITSKK